MKITRKQLRRLISEAIINEMPMIKPGGDIDPDHYEHIADMIDTGDEENIAHADFLASMVGHDNDNLSQDLKQYDQVSIMGAVGDFAHYLTDEDMQMLMNIAGKDLIYALYGWAGPGFGNVAIEGGPGIPANNFYEMAMRIAAKKKDFDQDDVEEHEGMESGISAFNKLAIAIISLSNKTIVDSYEMEDLGVGEEVGRRTGHYKFWNPEYEKLWEKKKLIIQGYVEPDPWDMH